VAYRTTNLLLLAHMGDLYTDELRPIHIERWLGHLRSEHVDSRGRVRQPISAGGFNAYLSSVRPFITWMYFNDLVARDYGETLRRRRRPHRVRLQLDRAQMRALLDGAESPRDRALLAMGFFTAMRASELRPIRVGDLNREKGTVFFRVWKSDLEDVLPLSPELRVELDRWLVDYERRVRRDFGRGLLPSDLLFPSYMPRRYAPGITRGRKGSAQRDLRSFEPRAASRAHAHDCEDRSSKAGDTGRRGGHTHVAPLRSPTDL